jgi:hypothetical protein
MPKAIVWQNITQRIQDHIAPKQGAGVILVTGPEGIGKTSVILQTLRNLRRPPSSSYVVYHCVGEETTDCVIVLQHLCKQLEELCEELVGSSGVYFFFMHAIYEQQHRSSKQWSRNLKLPLTCLFLNTRTF